MPETICMKSGHASVPFC